MKHLHSILFVLLLSISITSCSSDDENITSSVVGVWELTEWNANFFVDLNNDTLFNGNLLEEIDCANNEILRFEDNGVVTSSDTFNAKIEIFQQEVNSELLYNANIECADGGSIGFASSYIETNNTVEFNGSVSELIGNQIIRTFVDAIKIYNEDFTELVETRDLRLIYTKQ
jgi:hypothetical protein